MSRRTPAISALAKESSPHYAALIPWGSEPWFPWAALHRVGPYRPRMMLGRAPSTAGLFMPERFRGVRFPWFPGPLPVDP